MTYWLGVIVVTAIYMIAIIGVSILSGFTGLFSLGHAAFMAIGAYTSGLGVSSFLVGCGVGVCGWWCFGGVWGGVVGLGVCWCAYCRRRD